MVSAIRLGAFVGVVLALVIARRAPRRPPPPRTHVLQVTPEVLLLDGRLIAQATPRSMCEDCLYVDALLEVLRSEPAGRVVEVDFDPATASNVEHEVLFTIGLARDAALVRYSIFAK